MKPRVIDLFAGAGFLSSGFKAAGCELIFALEKDPIAAETYRRNLGEHILCNDIKNVRPFERCDILVAGPPCQGFSTLGKRDPNDPRNQLSLELIPWIKTTQPKIVVIENVPAFKESAEWKLLTNMLRKLGYSIDLQIHDALDFGVPQRRTRSFTFASKVGIPQPKRGRGKHLHTVRDAWIGLSPEPDGLNGHYAPNPSSLALARMKIIPLAGDKRDIMKQAPELAPPSWWRTSCEVTDVWGRMHWDRPCNTLRTALQNPSKGRYIHPEQNRVISLREAARLHTIPDTWCFAGLPTQIARQIGNGVPPMLGISIARAAIKLLK